MTDRDIDLYFGLSYSAYLVLEPARLARMDPADQQRLQTLIGSLSRAFPDIAWPHRYVAFAALGASPDALTDAEMQLVGCTFDDSEETGFPDQPYHYRGESYEGPEWLFFATEDEATAAGAGRTVVNRTLLQSMPLDWQYEVVALIDKHDEVDVATPEYHQVRAYNEAGQEIDDPIPYYNRTRTRLVPSLGVVK